MIAMYYATTQPGPLLMNLVIIALLLAMILSGVGGIVFLIVYLRRQSKEKK